jgi:enediyne biosynthesis protein E4
MNAPLRTFIGCAWSIWFLPALLLTSPLGGAEPGGPIQFRDVTRDTGIDFVHTDGSSGRRYIVETVASGLALLDYNGDGYTDIYFLNGSALPGADFHEPPRNRLYRNDGNWRFIDVTEEAGVGDTGYGLGVCVGDYNNDGYPDIYVNNFGPNILYRNNGDGTFTDVTEEAGVAAGNQVGAGAAFLDMNGNGLLDLFVANYVAFNFENHQISHMSGFPAYVGPLNYEPTANNLYRNNGDGTFTDVSVSSGIAAHRGTGMGSSASTTTAMAIRISLWAMICVPTSSFKTMAPVTSKRWDSPSAWPTTPWAMSTARWRSNAADWNNDGWPDFYMTSYQRQLTVLYQNQQGVFFEDVTRQTGAGTDTYPQVTWGTGLVDLDNDGHRDLFIACGHLIDNIEQFDDSTRYHARNILLQEQWTGPVRQCLRSGRGRVAAGTEQSRSRVR